MTNDPKQLTARIEGHLPLCYLHGSAPNAGCSRCAPVVALRELESLALSALTSLENAERLNTKEAAATTEVRNRLLNAEDERDRYKSILTDVIHGLRQQPEVSREQIAWAIETALAPARSSTAEEKP